MRWDVADDGVWLDILDADGYIIMLDYTSRFNVITIRANKEFEDLQGPVFHGSREECMAWLKQTQRMAPEEFLMEMIL